MNHLNDPIIYIFTNDLRLSDNPGFYNAAKANPVIPVFIFDHSKSISSRGEASRWWLFQSLHSLEKQLLTKDLNLICRKGIFLQEVKKIVQDCHPAAIYMSTQYDPYLHNTIQKIEEYLNSQNIPIKTFATNLLTSPDEIHNKQNKPYRVFTPFWKTIKQTQIRKPTAAPKIIIKPNQWPKTTPIIELNILPKHNWHTKLNSYWKPGEIYAQKRLRSFLKTKLRSYSDNRDFPSIDGTSKLSPHLHFGEISPVQIWHEVLKYEKTKSIFKLSSFAQRFLSEIAWREFSYHLLQGFPNLAEEPLKPEFINFPWKTNSRLLTAWKKGLTGYPILDAGMKELWETGWMHNRVRMIVASFLVKDLFQPWQEGERWFWDTLVDADLSSNSQNWQWVAGCATDAAPFYRVFNPTLQAKKFDPEGVYIKKWIPILRNLPTKYIHEPSQAPDNILKKSGIKIGKDYPNPIVDHNKMRIKALQEYKKLKR